MAKNLKFNIKNAQLAEALNLDKVKKEGREREKEKTPPPAAPKQPSQPIAIEPVAAAPVEIELPLVQNEREEIREETPPPVLVEKTPPTPVEKPKAALVKPPAERPGLVDDFRRPKIIRRAPLPPQPPAQPTATTRSPPAGRDGARPQSRPAPGSPPRATPTNPDKGKGSTPDKGGGASSDRDKKTVPNKPGLFKDYREVRSQRKPKAGQGFDGRDRMGLRDSDDERWRKKKAHKKGIEEEDLTIRPKILHVRLPITVKDLAAAMKLKTSQLISKLFMQGVAVTINDALDDETTIQLLGQEFDCTISIDTSEEERIKITDKSIKEEISSSHAHQVQLRPPVITFMGHVDHGKTSLIDAIRKSDRASGEAGAITQHIGAFKCHSDVGEITILDTPGHEAFSSMRARGAEVTDLVVLVIAGDEGMRDQTIEAMNRAKEAGVPILVAINKCDRPDFNAENVYRQLSEHSLLPEAWGGTTITVNCSAVSKQGIKELLEMLALQSEVLELKANPQSRARGTVIESEMHKGLGAVATVLVQNGTLRIGDPLVFDLDYARVKTMHDEHGKELQEAGPSTPVKITGLSGLPEAGSEFIAVKDEREARSIAHVRALEHRHVLQQKGKKGLEALFESRAAAQSKKVLHVLLRADVQGSLEALKQSLRKIRSDKVDLNIVSEDVGQISESDVSLAGASGAVVIGFHTKVESHAEHLIKEKRVTVKLHDIIYHAVDDVKELMRKLLDKIPQETDIGSAEVRTVFKSSQLGKIAGCIVVDGMIKRSNHIRLKRGDKIVWKGMINSLKRVKESVREVSKGLECGIVLQGFEEFEEGDILEAYEITYLEQEL